MGCVGVWVCGYVGCVGVGPIFCVGPIFYVGPNFCVDHFLHESANFIKNSVKKCCEKEEATIGCDSQLTCPTSARMIWNTN